MKTSGALSSLFTKLQFLHLRVFHFALHSKRKTRRWKTSEFDQTALEKTRGFDLRVFRFECGAKWKSRSWKTSEFDQSTSEFDETTSEQISEVFNSDFSVLGIVQNGKLGAENLGKLILRGFRVFRELRVFDLAHGLAEEFFGLPDEMENFPTDPLLGKLHLSPGNNSSP